MPKKITSSNNTRLAVKQLYCNFVLILLYNQADKGLHGI
jgi:hypothetical protein